MGKIRFNVLMALMMVVAMANADNRLTVSDIYYNSAESAWGVDISLENSDNVSGFQCDLVIPGNFEFITANYLLTERAQELESGKMMDTHSVVANVMDNGAMRMIVFSLDAKVFSGKSGKLMFWELKPTELVTREKHFPCNLVNQTIGTIDSQEAVATVYPHGVLNDETLSCYDATSDEVTVIGAISEDDVKEVKNNILTANSLVKIDFTRSTTDMGDISLPEGSEPDILLAHEGQIEDDDNAYIKKDDGWYRKVLVLNEGVKSVTQKRACTVGTLTYTRTWNNLNWQPLYVPFVMSYDDWKDDYDVAAINSFVGEDMDGDGVKEPSGMVLAGMSGGSLLPNVPYMIRAKATGKQTITLTDAEVAKTAAASVVLTSDDFSYTLTGTYRQVKEMATAGYYVMAGGLLCTAANDDVTLNPYRWYLSIKDAEGNVYLVSQTSTLSVIMLEDLEDEETAIGVAEVSPTAAASGRIYDLMGRTVKADALGKGIYIINNKKVMF